MPLVPAQRSRGWMDATNAHFANRCLPLLMANQAGWFLISAHKLRLTWNGADDLGAVKVEHLDGPTPTPAMSHFGSGIVTWNVPYLFRTSPGYNLLVRGPANWPKEGVSPLEGLVETDWSSATFTVNWRMTRPHFPVTFEVGEPLCMLVPQRRGELESFHPQLRMLSSEPALEDEVSGLVGKPSDSSIPSSPAPTPALPEQRWQKHYFQGVSRRAGGRRRRFSERPPDQVGAAAVWRSAARAAGAAATDRADRGRNPARVRDHRGLRRREDLRGAGGAPQAPRLADEDLGQRLRVGAHARRAIRRSSSSPAGCSDASSRSSTSASARR